MSKKNNILVCGSVVLDVISKHKFYGGTGANIAYGLGQLEARPLLFSLVGKDFNKDFRQHLEKSGVSNCVFVDSKNNTAKFSYSVNKHGIGNGIWSPNAYKNIDKLRITKTISVDDLENISIAIFSPGNAKSTLAHISEFKKINKKATVIFDPGQMITSYTKNQFIKCMNMSEILILNDLEYKQLGKILGKDPVLFFKKINKIIIKTEGEKGSTIFESQKSIKIKPVKPKKIVDTTGAGDAYRAGLLYGLSQGKNLKKACLIGTQIASKNVEFLGCQIYKIQNKNKFW